MRQPAVMTVSELADYLRVHQTTVYRLLKRNEIPSFCVGSNHRFLVSAIDDWMKSQQVKASA